MVKLQNIEIFERWEHGMLSISATVKLENLEIYQMETILKLSARCGKHYF